MLWIKHILLALSTDLQQIAAEFNCPGAYVTGSYEPITRVNTASKAVQVAPRSKLMIRKGVGHELLLQDALMTARRILTHCSAHLPR